MPSSVELEGNWSADPGGRPVAVVTGGTGAIGPALVRRLASELPGHRVLVLTRCPEGVRAFNTPAVFADIQMPDLGLAKDVRTLIENRATLIVHAAANTRFNLSVEEARLTNTLGTKHMLHLARACPRLRQFAHISTLYVAGRREGVVYETPLRRQAGYINSYEASKHEAEDAVLAEAGRLPVSIYRLSSVVDESPHHRLGRAGHFYQLIRFVPWSRHFPFFPAERGVPVDLIGSEWAARALSILITRHFTPASIRHICAGADRALPVEEVMERIFRAYELCAQMVLPRPRLVTLSEFERLCGRLPPEGRISRSLASFMTFIPHLSVRQPFDCSISSRLLGHSGVPRPDMSSLLDAALAGELDAH